MGPEETTTYPIWHEKLEVCALTNAPTPCRVEHYVKQHLALDCLQLLLVSQMTRFLPLARVFAIVSPVNTNAHVNSKYNKTNIYTSSTK